MFGQCLAGWQHAGVFSRRSAVNDLAVEIYFYRKGCCLGDSVGFDILTVPGTPH